MPSHILCTTVSSFKDGVAWASAVGAGGPGEAAGIPGVGVVVAGDPAVEAAGVLGVAVVVAGVPGVAGLVGEGDNVAVEGVPIHLWGIRGEGCMEPAGLYSLFVCAFLFLLLCQHFCHLCFLY